MLGSIGMPELILIFVVALLVFGPKKLPEIGKSLGKGLAEPGIRERYAQAALEPVGGSADNLARLLRNDYDKYSRLIRELNIKLE